MSSNLNIFGKNLEEIGSLDKNLVLRTKGKVYIRFGRKYIDLIDNQGNLNVKIPNVINKIDSVENINKDGIYLVDGILYAYINGELIQISGVEGTYINYENKQNLTLELTDIALQNIGLKFNSLNEVTIQQGIVFIKDKIYYINNGLSILISLDSPLSEINGIGTPNLNNVYIAYINGKWTFKKIEETKTSENLVDFDFNTLEYSKVYKIIKGTINNNSIYNLQTVPEFQLEEGDLFILNFNLIPYELKLLDNNLTFIENISELTNKNLIGKILFVKKDSSSYKLKIDYNNSEISLEESGTPHTIIGDISKYRKYSNKNFTLGLYSDQPIFSGTEFREPISEISVKDYPRYTLNLTNSLLNHYNDLEYSQVVPPLEIIKKLIPFLAGYYKSKESNENVPIDPSFIGTTYEGFSLSETYPYLWYTNDGKNWKLIKKIIEPDPNKYYFISSSIGYHDFGDGSPGLQYPAGFIGYVDSYGLVLIGKGKLNYIETYPSLDSLEDKKIPPFNRVFGSVRNPIRGAVPSAEGYYYTWECDNYNSIDGFTLIGVFSIGTNLISSVLGLWGNETSIPGYRIGVVDENNKILDEEVVGYIDGKGTEENWKNEEWCKSFLSFILKEFLYENRTAYNENTGWTTLGYYPVSSLGYGGYWTGRLSGLAEPSSNNSEDPGYVPLLSFSILLGHTSGNSYSILFEFSDVKVGSLTFLTNVNNLNEINLYSLIPRQLYKVSYGSLKYSITKLESNSI